MRRVFVLLLAFLLATAQAVAQDIPEIWPPEALSRDMSIVPRELLVDGFYQVPASFYHVELKAYSAGVVIWQDELTFDSLTPGRINELGALEPLTQTDPENPGPRRVAHFSPQDVEDDFTPNPIPMGDYLYLPQLGIGSVRLDIVSLTGAERLSFNGIEAAVLIDDADEIEITIWQRENKSSSPEAFVVDSELWTPEANRELMTGPEFDEADPAWARIVSYRGRHKPAPVVDSLQSTTCDF